MFKKINSKLRWVPPKTSTVNIIFIFEILFFLLKIKNETKCLISLLLFNSPGCPSQCNQNKVLLLIVQYNTSLITFVFLFPCSEKKNTRVPQCKVNFGKNNLIHRLITNFLLLLIFLS